MMLFAPARLASALLPLLVIAVVGCGQSPCPSGAHVDKDGGFCAVLPSGYQKASHNKGDGQDVHGFGPKGRMVMFVRRANEAEYTRVVKQVDERRATPPDSVKIVEIGTTETSAWQILQYKGQTTFETEYAFTDEKRTSFGRCTATYAKEDEAKSVLSACRTVRFMR